MHRPLVVIALTLSSLCHAVERDCFRPVKPSAAYVLTKLAELHSHPGATTSLLSLGFGSRLCALAVRSLAGERWAYVQQPDAPANLEPVHGWVPAASIVLRSDLRRLRALPPQRVQVEIGDYAAEYTIKRGGVFEVFQVRSEHPCRQGEIPNEYGACEDPATLVRGEVRGYGALAIAVDDTDYTDMDVFILTPAKK